MIINTLQKVIKRFLNVYMPVLRSGKNTTMSNDGEDNQSVDGEVPTVDNAAITAMSTQMKLLLEQMKLMQDQLNKCSVDTKPINTPAAGVPSVSNNLIAQNNNSTNNKLYDLPEFSGRPEDWPMFKEAFEETTAEYHYTQRQNMLRLQKAIKGEAREVVESLLIHSSNVESVMSTLKNRFGRPEQLVRSQLDRIQNVAPIAENNIAQIVPFATKVQNLATFLESADCANHLNNPMLMQQLELKLPIQQRLEWGRHARTIQPYANLRHMADWLNELAQTVSSYFVDVKQEKIPKNTQQKARFFHVNKEQNRIERKCLCCDGNHVLENCQQFPKLNVNQRWRVVRQKGLCFNCLKHGHRSGDCDKKHDCGESDCLKKLHKLLHNETNIRNEASVQNKFTSLAVNNKNQGVYFKILPVLLYANGVEVKSYAFLDEGSAVTMLDKNLAKQLNLEGREEKLTLQWFGDNTTTQMSSKVDVVISGVKNRNKKFQLKNVRTVDNLRLPIQSLRVEDLNMKDRWKKLPIEQYSEVRPKILIGLDNAHLGVAKRVINNKYNEPQVVMTKLGWVVYGTADEGNNNNHRFSCLINTGKEEESLNDLVKYHIISDNLDVKNTGKNIESNEIVRAKRILNETTIRKGERFETGLLWKHDNVQLPYNRVMAEKRLVNLEKKLGNNEGLREKYNCEMKNFELKGYSKQLSYEEATVQEARTWYLPHFGVVNASKPDKLRIVFDAAAELSGHSLNSELMSGPDLGVSLLAVLMKFRQKPVAVSADIAEMFNQVGIREEDQCAQRYLWRPSPEHAIQEYAMTVMTFGATCSPCSAQFTKNKNAEEFRHMYPDAVEAIIKNHYVDDYVHCFDTEEEAVRISKQVVWVHKQGGFNLRRFTSNSDTVSEELGGEQSNVILNLNRDGTTQKVLGMCWDTKLDVLKFALSFDKIDTDLLQMRRTPTKREVLAITMSIFDPFGVAAEYTLVAKLLLQTIWKSQLSWDDMISAESHEGWKKWLITLDDIKNVSISRCYDLKFCIAEVELHIFADASELAYAAVAYWRILSETGITSVRFVMGKSKCAPLKTTTIPRLELQAAVLATRLRAVVLENHDVKPTKIIMWSDSKTVVSWIKSDQRLYKPYVAHRVNEILEGSSDAEWHWLPGVQNPADFGTRKIKKERESLWLTGPEFLKNENVWPNEEVCNNTTEELRAKARILVSTVAHDVFSKFSSYLKLKRIFAWVLRFCNNAIKNNAKMNGSLTVHELRQAEIAVLKGVQISVYHDDYNVLQNNKAVKKCSTLFKLTPILGEDGLIKINGRINNATAVQACSRNPIILPQKHHVTQLIVDWYHRIWGHQNENTIVAEIRRKYWVPHLREEAKRAVKRCTVCMKMRAKPQNPQMGQLPEDRLTPFIRPFSYVGLDYMGPFNVTMGRRSEKRWIAIFTCLTMRAIHLEVAHDLSTDTCLMCIQNFMNRRGRPVRIRSDNGTNFIGAQKKLKQLTPEINNQQMADALTTKEVEWVFNCPLNPHAGGSWERLVRSVKRAMGYAVGSENLSEHGLFNLMCQAENIVNSRPLTHIPIDHVSSEPITPNHFILGTANSDQTPHPQEEMQIVTKRQLRKLQQIQYSLWKQWVREYLPDMCRRTKWWQPVKPLQVGDVVMICDHKIQRRNWPLGIIEKTYAGRDGAVRSAKVKTTSGTYDRPACMLARLDVRESEAVGVHGGQDVAAKNT